MSRKKKMTPAQKAAARRTALEPESISAPPFQPCDRSLILRQAAPSCKGRRRRLALRRAADPG